MKYKIGDVIYYNTPHPSHSWANGLKAIVKTKGHILTMTSIKPDGTASLLGDGTYSVSCTSGLNNEFITKTSLSFKVDKTKVA